MLCFSYEETLLVLLSKHSPEVLFVLSLTKAAGVFPLTANSIEDREIY